MNIEEIIRAWKILGKNEKVGSTPENPAGELELSDEELELVEGGASLLGFDTGEMQCPSN